MITLVLYFGNEHWRAEKHLKDLLDIPEGMEEYVNDLKINVFEIAWLTDEQISMFKSDFRIVADFFVRKRKNKDYVPDNKTEIRHVDAVLKMLSAVTGDRRYENILSDGKGKVSNMCEVAERLEQMGIEKGRLEGEQMTVYSFVHTPNLQSLWTVCSDFLAKSTEKAFKLSDLVKTLKMRPYKLKQGVIDFWLPIFLFVRQQEFALYNGETFVLNINKELFELLQKRLNDFTIKAFDVNGIKLELFNKYREFLNKERGETITSNSLMDTIRPFFNFYNGLNKYAKTTRKFDYDVTAKFRDVLATAKDPCKAFLEDIPAALGYNDFHNEEFAAQYLQLIKTAVHELVICYDLFIDRIEDAVVGYLGLPHDYIKYKEILVQRYSSINKGLLTTKSKSFLDRVLAPSDNKREFYEKIGLVVFDRKIESIEDKEEALFLSNLTHLFGELERYTAFNEVNNETDEVAFNFELATSKGDFKSSRTYRLPKVKLAEVAEIENRIQTLLSGNDELDVCILLKMLNEKLR